MHTLDGDRLLAARLQLVDLGLEVFLDGCLQCKMTAEMCACRGLWDTKPAAK